MAGQLSTGPTPSSFYLGSESAVTRTKDSIFPVTAVVTVTRIGWLPLAAHHRLQHPPGVQRAVAAYTVGRGGVLVQSGGVPDPVGTGRGRVGVAGEGAVLPVVVTVAKGAVLAVPEHLWERLL